MAITATTNSAAIGTNDTTVAVAATTGITAPNFQTGSGITLLLIDQEYMLVTGVNTTSKIVNVVRGTSGSAALAHVVNGQVQIGSPSDFQHVNEQYNALIVSALKWGASYQPATFLAGSADALDNTKSGFYEIKTAGVDAMTLTAPPASAEGAIIEIVSDTTNAHTLTATSLLANGTALKTTATFPAFRGAYLKLRASNGIWQVLSNGASAGVVVLT